LLNGEERRTPLGVQKTPPAPPASKTPESSPAPAPKPSEEKGAGA
jgi:hypothetical protein